MIILLSAATGFVAFYVARIVYAVLDRPVTFGRLIYFGLAATVLYVVLAHDSVPGHGWYKVGFLMLSIALYVVTTTVFRLIEAVTELVNLRFLLESPRR